MKRINLGTLLNAVAACIVALFSANALATTLTFEGNPDHSDNADVNGSYGSGVSSNSTEFVTTDGSGATPNITLTWPTSNQFEYHSNTGWQAIEDVSGASAETHVLQANLGSYSGGISITLTPDAGFGVVFNSVDMGFGTGLGGGSAVGIATIARDLDSSVVSSESTSSLTAGNAEQLDFSYTGLIGESYTLTFTYTADTTNGSVNGNWAAIDDLSFSQIQIPEPSSAALLGLGGLVLILRRKR